jgi:hypothetical protein
MTLSFASNIRTQPNTRRQDYEEQCARTRQHCSDIHAVPHCRRVVLRSKWEEGVSGPKMLIPADIRT